MNERIVIDSNALIQMLGVHSKYNILWKRFMERRYILCVSSDIMLEYEEMLKQKSSSLVAEMFMKVMSLAPNIIQKDPFYRYGLILSDPDDNKFVDCAIAVGAKFIVSDDHHFDVLTQIPFPKVKVCKLEEFYQSYC